MFMKKYFTLFSLLCFCVIASAQGTLQFNKVIIFTSTTTPTSPPSGKVWKVTSVMGSELRFNHCLDLTSSTDELRSAVCGATWNTGGYPYAKVPFYAIRTVSINGNSVIISLSGLSSSTNVNVYTSAGCTGTAAGVTPAFSCANQSTDPTILPLWIPSGTTFGVGGSSTFASIIEFNILP
jgi:hypothetical protein